MEQQLAYSDQSPGIATEYWTGDSLDSHTLPRGKFLQHSAFARPFLHRAHKRYGDNSLD